MAWEGTAAAVVVEGADGGGCSPTVQVVGLRQLPTRAAEASSGLEPGTVLEADLAESRRQADHLLMSPG